MRLWFAAFLLLFSCAVFAIPQNPAALIPDFFSTISEFIGSVNSWIYGWVKERWMDYMYGDYQKLLEYDLGGIETGSAESFLSHPLDRSDPLEHYAAASVDSMQSAYSSIRLAAGQRSRCIDLYKKRETCKEDCPTAYSIKACTDAFFTHLNSATAKINESFDYAMRQISSDYYAYKYYGLEEDAQNGLFGCYLAVVDIYNDFSAFQGGGTAHAEKVREEADIGDRIVRAFSSIDASPKFYNNFFNALGGGKDAVVFQLLNQHQECRSIEKNVLSGFSEKKAGFAAKLGERQADFEKIKKETLCTLNQQDIGAVLSGEEIEKQELSMQISPEDKATGSSPEQSCDIIEAALSNLTALNNRLRTEENSNRFLARASQEMGDSEKTFSRIDGNLARTRTQTEGIGRKAQSRAESLKSQVLLLRGEIPESDAKGLLLSEFDAMLKKADSAMQEARNSGTEGGRTKKYSLAVRHLLAIQEAFGPTNKTEDTGALLLQAEEMLALAKSDDIEASRESSLIANARAHMDSGRGLAASALLKAAMSGLSEKAGSRYSDLGSQRERIKAETSFLSEAGFKVDSSRLESYEKFFQDNELNTQKALGSLKKMKADYDTFGQQLSGTILSNQSAILSSILSKKQPAILGDVAAGEPAQVSLDLEFTNPLPYSLDPKTISVPLAYSPAGRISDRDLISSHLTGAAQEGDRLVLFVDAIEPKGTLKLNLLYDSILAQADVDITEAHTQKNAAWKFYVKTTAPPGIRRLLVPVPDNAHFLERFPQDFLRSGSRQYLMIWHPGAEYEREFSTPSGLSIERKVERKDAAQSPKVRVYEKVSIKNGLGVRLNGVRIELPLYTKVEELKAATGALEGANLVLKADLAPKELKIIGLNYTINDPQFYSEILLSEADTKLSILESRADSARFSGEIAQLRARRESANRLYSDGNYESAVSELIGLGADAARLENIANQDSSLREAFLRLNQSFSEKLSGLKGLNSLYLLLGMQNSSKNTKPLEDTQSLAGREFSRGDASLALELLSNSSMPQIDEKALARAVGSRKAELSGRLDNFTRLRIALSVLGKKDDSFNSLIENISLEYGEFSVAASGRNYSRAGLALEALDSSMDAAAIYQQQMVSEADAIGTEFLANRSSRIGALEKELASLDYANALSLHLPPAVGAWARENGIVDESDDLSKMAGSLQSELSDEKRAISTAFNMSAVPRLLFIDSKKLLASDAVDRAQAFASTVQSILVGKEEDSSAALKDSEDRMRGGKLEGDAGIILSSARRAQEAGRFQDSLAYTSYAVAVFSKQPPAVSQYIVPLLALLVVLFAYVYRRKLSKKPGGESDIDAAERRISIRKDAR